MHGKPPSDIEALAFGAQRVLDRLPSRVDRGECLAIIASRELIDAVLWCGGAITLITSKSRDIRDGRPD